MHTEVLSAGLKGDPFEVSSLSFCAAHFSVTSLDSQVCLLNSGRPPGSALVLLPSCNLESLSRHYLEQSQDSTHLFLLSGIIALHCLISSVWKLLLYIHYHFGNLFFSSEKVIPIPVLLAELKCQNHFWRQDF